MLGEIVPAKPGTDTEFNKDIEGALIDPENENQLLAEIRGHPLISKNAVKVDTSLVLDNVNLKTGNIDFEGSVLVRGEVLAGFQVIATRDVIVKGIVENAKIVAGRDIIISGGVIGSEVQQLNTSHNQDLETTSEAKEKAASQTGKQPDTQSNQQAGQYVLSNAAEASEDGAETKAAIESSGADGNTDSTGSKENGEPTESKLKEQETDSLNVSLKAGRKIYEPGTRRSGK